VSRRSKSIKRPVPPDPRYDSQTVSKFVNNLMYQGKKSLAEGLFYKAMDLIEERTGQPGVAVFKQAVNNAKPMLEVKSRRVGGASLQVPVEVRPDRRTALAMRWLIQFSRARTEKTMAERLAAELIWLPKAKATRSRRRKTRTGWLRPTGRSRTTAGSRFRERGQRALGEAGRAPPTPASPRARWPLSPSLSPFSRSPFFCPVDIPHHSAIFARLRHFGPFRPPKVAVATSGHVTAASRHLWSSDDNA